MEYFHNIRFINGAEIPVCRAVIDSRFVDTFNLQFILAGKMYFGLNHGPRVILEQSAVFWHSPENFYQYGPATESGWHHFWFTFQGQRGEEIMRRGFSQLSPAGYLPVLNSAEIREIFQQIISFIKDDYPRSHPEAVVLLEKLLCLLMAEKSVSKGAGRHADALHKLAAAIRGNPVPAYDFRALAKKLGLSYSHFRQCFRARFGRAPHDFLLYCRMKYAAIKLHDPEARVGEVAAACGYEDQAQFAKLFHHKIGLYPRQYRQVLPGK
jgi:AraC-like DNA-binding protein